MRRATFLIALGAMLATPGVGQVAEHHLFGPACNGHSVEEVSANDLSLVLSLATPASEYAFPVVNPRSYPVQLLGFNLWTRTVSGLMRVPASFYRDAQGSGARSHSTPASAPEATGEMILGQFPVWWGTEVYSAPVLQPGEAFWVGFRPAGQAYAPINVNGTGSPAAPLQRQTTTSTWNTFAPQGFAAVRIRFTTATPAVPLLSSPDLPRLGQLFRLQFGPGTPFAPAMLVWAQPGTVFSTWAGQTLPARLDPFGAPDCWIQTTCDVPVFVPTDAQGNATVSTTLPANPGLLGLFFQNQGLLLRPTNALGVITTNGAVARIGT